MNEQKQHSRNKIWLFAVAGIALLLAAAGILALTLTPSGRVRTIRTLCANDFFCGDPIEIPYRTKGLPHGVATSFQCEDLAALARQLPSKLGQAFEAEQFGENSLLIWRKSPVACYLIQRQTGEKAGSRCNFLLFNMEAVLDGGASTQTFVFPYHLIALMESQGTLYYRFNANEPYETQYSKRDFLNFYKRLGQYTITETKDGFRIMRAYGISSEPEQQGTGTVSVPDRGLNTPVRFAFLQEGGKRYLRLSATETDGA